MASRILSPYGRMRGDESAGNPIYTRQPPASPVHLSGSLVLRNGANGSIPAASLKNPMGQDMEILEIKFELSGPYIGGLTTGTAAVFGGTVWCSLTMGGIKITNGAVPIWNFGRTENYTTQFATRDTNDSVSFSMHSWRLPRPLFVPAGAALIPEFTHTGLTSSAINVRMGYSARTVFKKPKKLYVPWVAKYQSKAFNPVSSAATDKSSQLDLVNPYSEPLHLQRFVGHTLFILGDGSSGEDLSPSFNAQYLTMRMSDSYGRPIVRSYVPFTSVFNALTKSWEMSNGAMLDPESYYLVDLKQAAMTLAAGGLTGGLAQSFVSMVGWRELENA